MTIRGRIRSLFDRRPRLPDEEKIMAAVDKSYNFLWAILVFLAIIVGILFCIYASFWLLGAIAATVSAFFSAVGSTGFGGLKRG